MSISARTRQSTWSTDAPEASTGSGAQFCEGEARRHWAYCSFLGEARNFARLGIRREVAARRPISKARPISAAPHPATRKSLSAASKSPPCGEVPKPPHNTQAARSSASLKPPALSRSSFTPTLVLGSKSLPVSDFKLSSRKFGRSVSRRGSAFAERSPI